MNLAKSPVYEYQRDIILNGETLKYKVPFINYNSRLQNGWRLKVRDANTNMKYNQDTKRKAK